MRVGATFGISTAFAALSPAQGQITHALLALSPLSRQSYCYNADPVRLACLIHATSVRSEPESNSQKKKLRPVGPKPGGPFCSGPLPAQANRIASLLNRRSREYSDVKDPAPPDLRALALLVPAAISQGIKAIAGRQYPAEKKSAARLQAANRPASSYQTRLAPSQAQSRSTGYQSTIGASTGIWNFFSPSVQPHERQVITLCDFRADGVSMRSRPGRCVCGNQRPSCAILAPGASATV